MTILASARAMLKAINLVLHNPACSSYSSNSLTRMLGPDSWRHRNLITYCLSNLASCIAQFSWLALLDKFLREDGKKWQAL